MTRAYVEIPANSMYKYELDKESGLLCLDRPLNQHIPANYGFIPDTLAEDGDALDVFIITNHPLLANTYCDISILGIMQCTDNGVSDNKIIAALKDENPNRYWNLEVDCIKKYLETYKPGFVYGCYLGEDYAREEIREYGSRYKDSGK